MAVKASQHDIPIAQDEQQPVSLLTLQPDGSLNVHPALVRAGLPTLVGALSVEGVQHEPSQSGEDPTSAQEKGYETAAATNRRLGRTWAAEARRLLATHVGLKRYAAYQKIADGSGYEASFVRICVEANNRRTKARRDLIRKARVWRYHAQGLSHSQIALKFPHGIHPKTVGRTIKGIRKALKGVDIHDHI